MAAGMGLSAVSRLERCRQVQKAERTAARLCTRTDAAPSVCADAHGWKRPSLCLPERVLRCWGQTGAVHEGAGSRTDSSEAVYAYGCDSVRMRRRTRMEEAVAMLAGAGFVCCEQAGAVQAGAASNTDSSEAVYAYGCGSVRMCRRTWMEEAVAMLAGAGFVCCEQPGAVQAGAESRTDSSEAVYAYGCGSVRMHRRTRMEEAVAVLAAGSVMLRAGI